MSVETESSTVQPPWEFKIILINIIIIIVIIIIITSKPLQAGA